jgi:pseudouridine-5'-phosphate glycosidase
VTPRSRLPPLASRILLYRRVSHSIGVPSRSPVRVLPLVADALLEHRPVVALESSVLAQGLPIPANRRAAERMLAAVSARGAVAAITAVLRGTPTVGLEPDELEAFLRRDGVEKVSARDLPAAMVKGATGATTVAAGLALANLAGVSVFATGGIGGVHREVSSRPTSSVRDESGDLVELAQSSVVVVCAGAKAILDLPATWERLETLGVLVVGYRTSELPAFFTAESGIRLSVRVDSPAEIARLFRAQRALGRRGSLLVVQPPPAAVALERAEVDRAVTRALERAALEGVRGAAVTPYLLAAVERETHGRSLEANLGLLEQNAALAAEIAISVVRGEGDDRDGDPAPIATHARLEEARKEGVRDHARAVKPLNYHAS